VASADGGVEMSSEARCWAARIIQDSPLFSAQV